ncbi:hypothetical protein CHUAL_001689 [Chamberlinius hualienensis]
MSLEVSVQSLANAHEHVQSDSDCLVVDVKSKPTADMTRMSSTVVGEEIESPVKIKEKRMVHNEVERRRKVKINNHIFTLAKLLPNKDGKKWSKNEVLTKAIEYVQEIKESHEKLLIGKMDEVQADEFKNLKRRIEELEKQNTQYVKLLEIAGFPATPSGCVKSQCDKLPNKLDPSTIVMDDDGEISVVSPSKFTDSTISGNKRRSKPDFQSSPKKQHANGMLKSHTGEGLSSSPNSSLSRGSTPQQSSPWSSDNQVAKAFEIVSTATVVISTLEQLKAVTMTGPLNTTAVNITGTKEPILGNINGGITAVTHALQGGPIMSTSQSSPQLQMQPTATVVPQIPMLNFGGTVNLMQGAPMQPVLTINEQGIQVIQMVTTPSGSMVVNSNGTSTPNLLLTSNTTPAAPNLIQQGNSVQIDRSTGSTPTLISAESATAAGMPMIQQTVCGGSLIAQGTQYMTTNPQVHLMTNSPPIIPTAANGNVMLGATVQGANTVLTLNPNPNSAQLPSALMLPNGQIISVVREPQLPLIYQNQTQFNGGLLMSTNSARNSSCNVFGTKAITTLSNCVNNNSTNNVTSDVVVCTEVTTSTVATTKVSAVSRTATNSDSANHVSTSSLNSTNEIISANAGKLVTRNNADVSSNTLPPKGNQSPVTNKTSGGAKNKSKRLPVNRSQRNIKPKPTADSSSGKTATMQLTKSPALHDKNELSSSAADQLNVSTNVSSTTLSTEISTCSIIDAEVGDKGKECVEVEVMKSNTAQKTSEPPSAPEVVPPNTMADILAQATESIFANSMSDISNSPNPTYFGNCSNTNGDNVDFLNNISESATKTHTPVSTSFSDALSSSTMITSSSETQQTGARNCSMTVSEIESHNMNGKCRGSRNNAADILSDLVGEVYRAANANTPNSLISACVSSFEGQNQQPQCDVTLDNSHVSERLASDSTKSKRCGTEDDSITGKRVKLNSKSSSNDLTVPSPTVTSSGSVSFLSVSQLASSASASSGNVASTSASSCIVSLSNSVSSVMPFSIDTGTSNENSPLCSISPLLNSPSKSNDIFALSSTIVSDDHAFSTGSIAPTNSSNNISSITGSSGIVTSGINTAVSSSINMAFPGLTNTFVSNNTSSTSVSASAAFTYLNNLNSGNTTDVHENYRNLPYQHTPVHRGNVNGINFQTNDPLGFSLAGSSSTECFLDKNNKMPNFDYISRSRPNHSLQSHSIATSSSTGSCISAAPTSVPFSSNLGSQAGQFNRIPTYSSIPLSHPVSPRHQHLVPSPVNMDSSHNDDISCGPNKNKTASPRHGNINAPDNIGQPILMSPSGMNNGCLQRSGSVRQLSNSAGGHQNITNQLNQPGIGCSVADQSQQHRQSISYSNGNHRIHSINRQSPKVCSGNSPSPISTPDLQGHSPIGHRGNSNSSSASSTTNASPKMSPIGNNVALNQPHIPRSSHSNASGNLQSPSLSTAPFLHQRSPNLEPPLITSFATESLTMNNICNNNSNNVRRDSLFPPGQKQLTHPPLSMPSSTNSCAPPRGAISYSAESLIQTQDNSSHNRPNCARENHIQTSNSNTVLRQAAPIHNSGSMASPHTLPFMHGSHLNRTSDDNQQVGFPYFPFQQTPEQASHLIPLKPNHQMNHSTGGKNHLQNTQPQPNFSFSLMPTSNHQSNSDAQQHLQDQQIQQQHQRHGNYLSVGNYSQIPPPMPVLESMVHKDISRPPMAFPSMPSFSTTQSSGDQSASNVRHRHSASFLTSTNRDHAIGPSTFPESYSAVSSSLAPLPSNAMVVGNGSLVPLPIQSADKVSGYKPRTQNANKQDGKMSKSKQSQNSKKKNQQYQIEEINLSNSIFETGRSTTPYFAIPSLSPPRNNEGPTYIPNANPLFNKSRVGKSNSGLSTGATSNHSKTGDSYNLFHTRPQTGFNLNFQAPTFTVNHLHSSAVGNDNNNTAGSVNQIGSSHINSAPPPPPALVSSSSSHVPNFNLSNIFPDINTNNESLNISPIKFHGNSILPHPPTPGSSQSGADGHTIQHSQPGPLYHTNRSHHPPPTTPHPSVIHNGMTINSILSHNPHSFDGRPQMPVGINNTMTPWTWTSNIQ